MIDKSYLVRDAAALLKLARSTSDPSLATAMIDKAAELKTRIDESDYPDVTPIAPDVEPSAPSQMKKPPLRVKNSGGLFRIAVPERTPSPYGKDG